MLLFHDLFHLGILGEHGLVSWEDAWNLCLILRLSCKKSYDGPHYHLWPIFMAQRWTTNTKAILSHQKYRHANIWGMLHDPQQIRLNSIPIDFCTEISLLKPSCNPILCSFGRRICPGQHVAETMVSIQMATFLAVLNNSKTVEMTAMVDLWSLILSSLHCWYASPMFVVGIVSTGFLFSAIVCRRFLAQITLYNITLYFTQLIMRP